jgi:hypothetical protein
MREAIDAVVDHQYALPAGGEAMVLIIESFSRLLLIHVSLLVDREPLIDFVAASSI